MNEINRYFDGGYLGGVIGSYKIIEIKGSVSNPRNPVWVMECSCGKRIEVVPSWVINNGIGKCECGRRIVDEDDGKYTFEISKLDRDRLRRLRRLIISRCYNVNDNYYTKYGEKGIRVQRNWLNSIDDFIEWSINNGYRPWFYLKRFNRLKGYTEDNCYWSYREIKQSVGKMNIDIDYLKEFNIDVSILLKLIDTNEIERGDLKGIEAFLSKIYNSKSRRPVVKIRKEINKSIMRSSKEVDNLLTMIQSYNITNEVTRISRVQELVEQAMGLLVLASENLEGDK